MHYRIATVISSALMAIAPTIALAQPLPVATAQPVPPPNYDESRVPKYVLPELLAMKNGQRVVDAVAWRDKRRPEIVRLFEQYVYGKAPDMPADMSFKVKSTADALEGTAVRKEVTIRFTKDGTGPKIDLIIYLPKATKRPVPLFVGLNFGGNQTIHADPGITPSDIATMKPPVPSKALAGPFAQDRGSSSQQWPVEKILARGYGLATAWYGDIEPDNRDGMRLGVRQLYLNRGQAKPADDEWGAIAAWAWGLSRMMDYLQTDREIDAKHVALIGHSRLGKTAVWAGARDERFAMVISNNSGCGGASLARRRYGETVTRITTALPYWFCENYRTYANRIDALPVDQHMLLALVAPRPLYVASAEGDRWSDPHGEFLSALGASPAYRLLGTDGLPATEMPEVEHPVQGTISYHIRHGKHDVTDYDWQQYLDAADRHFKRK